MSRAYLLLILFGLLVAIGAVGYRQGYRAATTQAEAEQAAHLRNAIAQAEAIAEQDRAIYAAGDARVARVQRVFQTIDREVIRYVQAHPLAVECLDADGLRLWTAANAGHLAATSGDSRDAGPLPGDAAAAEGYDRPDAAGGSRGAGAAVSPTPGRGRDVGGVDAGKPPHWGWQ